MKQVLAILKFVISFIFVVSFITSIFILFGKKYDALIIIFTTVILASIFGIYVYYLIQTGIWNFKNRAYLLNVFLPIGLLVHFIMNVVVLYCGSLYTIGFFVTTTLYVLMGFAIGVYDFLMFVKAWKYKKLMAS